MTSTNPRPAALAGRWYPADPEQLRESVDRYLAEAAIPQIKGQILGLVSPHAGHIYSGPVAGYSFAAVQGFNPNLVVILAPLHQPEQGALLTTAHEVYRTPLGEIPVDHHALDELDELLQVRAGLSLNRIARDKEHAVEVLLPFLQRSLQEMPAILPLMLRDQRPETMKALAGCLADILRGKKPLLIASTDLSHFYSAPEAEALDRTIIERIIELDPEGIYRVEQQEKGYACGKGGLAAVIWAAKNLGANQAVHLKYSHSGEITGDTSRVVGYEAAALLQK